MKPALDVYFEVAEDIPAAICERVPSVAKIEKWMLQALKQIQHSHSVELSIRALSLAESNRLNLHYRNIDKATNVLSFPSELPDFIDSNHIGDIAICAEILEIEAAEQNKSVESHWAHLCVHGLLHLLGYDHITEQDAAKMEAIEIATLLALSIDDPYQVR